MRTFIKGIAVALIVLVAVVFVLMRKGVSLDKESKAFADDAIVRFIADWDTTTFHYMASSELKQVIDDNPDSFSRLIERYKTLGTYRAFLGSEGGATVNVSPKGKEIVAEYTANVRFDSAPARVHIGLAKREGHWVIRRFSVSSPFLLER